MLKMIKSYNFTKEQLEVSVVTLLRLGNYNVDDVVKALEGK